MNDSEPRTTGDWLKSARAIAPLTAKYRSDFDRERRVPEALVLAMVEAGIFRMLLPLAFGGFEVTTEAALSVVEELSRQDGSLGWCAAINMIGGLYGDALPAATTREIFDRPEATISASFNLNGTATPVEGGYRVNGQWTFLSGCQYATWIGVNAGVVDEAGVPVPADNGGPQMRMCLLPVTDGTIVDTWHTAGLRGTGSHDVRIDNLVVPENHSIELFTLVRNTLPGQVYPVPLIFIGEPLLATVALGIARDALDSCRELTETKQRGLTRVAEQHVPQDRYGHAEAALRAARAFMFESTLALVQAGYDGRPLEPLRAISKLANGHAGESATHAVDLVWKIAGASAVFESSRIERCFRDVNMVTQNPAAQPRNIEMAGQYFLGGPLAGNR